MKCLLKRLLVNVLLCPLLLSSLLLSASAQEVFEWQGGSDGGVAVGEGLLPEDVISVVMPTAPADMFDFILDPNNLIKRTRAQRYDGAKFGEGNLFFKNSAADGSVSYSMNSDSLTLINKSTCPLTVSMSLTVDKGNNEFVFSNKPDFLDADSRKIESPALYLALVCGADRAPVQETEDEEGQTLFGANMETWVCAPANAYHVVWDADSGTYVYQLKENVKEESFSSISINMTGVINDADWEGFEGDVAIALVWDVESPLDYEAGPAENPNPDALPLIAVVEYARAENQNAVLSLSYGFGTNKTDKVTKMTYVTSSGAQKSVNLSTAKVTTPLAVSGQIATVKAELDIFEGRDWNLVFASSDGKTIYSVPFVLRGSPETDIEPDVTEEPNAGSGDLPSVTVNTPATAPKDSVAITVSYGSGGLTKVIALTYKQSGKTAITTVNVGNSYFKADGASVTLGAVSTVFNGSDWRLRLASEDGSKTLEIPFNLKKAGSVEGVAATVTQAASAAKDTVNVTVDFGGTFTKVTALTYKQSGKTAITTVNVGNSYFKVNGASVTLGAVSTVFNGSDWKLVLANDDNSLTISVPINIKSVG